MASVRRQVDTASWLNNKLSTDDPWSGPGFRSLLTHDVLRNIPECFHRLETQVKIKLLMAFLHVPRRVLEETTADISETLEIGSQDEDEWVRVLCEILKFYPTSGTLNVHLEGASPVFAEVTEQLRSQLANTESTSNLLPLECTYLNKMALHSVVGKQPVLPKHFTLSRKPKSAALRAELLQKASEALSAQKKSSGTSGSSHKLQSPVKKFEPPSRVTTRPIHRPRSLNSSASSSRSLISAATLKQHGRTKLLDINEQPIGGGREVKRRKKIADAEQAEDGKQKKATEAAKPQEPVTPDYAAGLQPLSTQTKATPIPTTPTTTTPPTPSYAVITSRGLNTAPTPTPPSTSSTTNLSESTLNLKRELETAVEQQRRLIRERQLKRNETTTSSFNQSPGLSKPTPVTPSTAPLNSIQPGQENAANYPSSSQPQQLSQQQQQQQQQLLQQQQNKRQLTLSREQMLAAHEMFKNANRVSRAEKALILGFMAGARDKPFPNQGPVITIKLSENTENVQAADGSQQTLLVEMLFEMNYDTGHWRRLKRTRVVAKQNPGQPQTAS